MLPLLLASIVFFFLVVGAMVFVICAVLPAQRRFALSAALWCAAWGPCSVASIMLFGMALVVDAFARNYGVPTPLHAINPTKLLSQGYLTLSILASATIATCLAWLHQAIMNRLAFALFRIYAAALASGIGGILGLCIGYWLMTMGESLPVRWILWIATTCGLAMSFGVVAYQGARTLRGQQRPTAFTWITADEFAGE